MSSQLHRTFNFDAAILAVLWPGLGHIRLGQPKRGRLIMFGVLFLILTGVLVGGLDCVDRRENHLWFLAQALNGPVAFALDWANQSFIKSASPDFRNHTRSLAHVNEMGTLFVALAGLMNLVAILDAFHYAPPPIPDRRRPEAGRAQGGSAVSGGVSRGRAGAGAGNRGGTGGPA